MPLSTAQIHHFITTGFIKIDHAFSAETAAAARDILWAATGCDPHDPATWTAPVIRLGEFAQEPFQETANTPVLLEAFDQLVGPGNWLPRMSLGSFPVRFPHPEQPNDTGWHVDASFPGAHPYDYMNWRINIFSKGRGLLMLFLFSDVSENDAPTRIRISSHRKVAQILRPYGEAGLSFMELAGRLDETENSEETVATGAAGTVYLCHPFIAHAAQAHSGTNPKFMAQPPLLLKRPLDWTIADSEMPPVQSAIAMSSSIN